MTSHTNRHRRKLAVFASKKFEDGVEEGNTSSWALVPCTSIHEVIEMAQAGALDAVALPFDAMDEQARDTFLQLTRIQKNQKPVLVSYATFNPDWIENLAFGSGANIHIRGDLKLDEVFCALDAHLRNKLSASA